MDNPSPDPYAESIDWASVWRNRMERQNAVKNYCRKEGFWASPETVRRYFPLPRGGIPKHIGKKLAGMGIPEGARVLDIGAGSGSLAVPLAKRGCAVTVVEPSAAMRDLMAGYAAKEQVTGIRVIPKTWEETDPDELGEPFDLVIASHSLSMPEIRPAIEKMARASKGSVYLYWFLTPPVWARVLAELWPKVHGAKYYFGPTADVLYQVLLQMGIFANLAPEEQAHPQEFASLGDATKDFARRMNTTDPGAKRIITGHLRTRLTLMNGGYTLRGTWQQAKIWWNAGP